MPTEQTTRRIRSKRNSLIISPGQYSMEVVRLDGGEHAELIRGNGADSVPAARTQKRKKTPAKKEPAESKQSVEPKQDIVTKADEDKIDEL